MKKWKKFDIPEYFIRQIKYIGFFMEINVKYINKELVNSIFIYWYNNIDNIYLYKFEDDPDFKILYFDNSIKNYIILNILKVMYNLKRS